MKLSKYNFFYHKNKRCIVFNTFANSITILTPEEYLSLHNLTSLSENILDIYRRLGIIIEDNVDELAMMRFDNTYFNVTSEPHFRVLTTTACNAKCTYCYEHGVSVKTMDTSTAAKVVAFIKNTVAANQKIHIEWFGGEPLVNMQVITMICTQLSALGYSFESTMVSNGILLTPDRINTLKTICHLSKVQITLDGLAEIYSKVKGVPPETFDTVIKNIKSLADNEITVQIRMNYTDNQPELSALIQYLGDFLGFNKRIFYYVYPIFEKQKSVPFEIMEKVLILNDKLLSTGLMKKSDLYKFSYRQTRCFATSYNGYTIAPDGNLYNCTHVMNDKGRVGTLDLYSPYNANRIRFVDQGISEECSECKLYPFCKGGCRVAELGEANLNQCVIYKSCIEAVLDRLLDMENNQEGGA